ncbi:hypothetical protein ECZU42_50970 [Escherichia coli]|nr:hypothetical protein ECZU42_50970 [Escherichia coli]
MVPTPEWIDQLGGSPPARYASQYDAFLAAAHHVENAGVIIHIEIEINFHPALVGVTRHGVPKLPEPAPSSPYSMAGFQYIRDKIFVNRATVTGEVIA